MSLLDEPFHGDRLIVKFVPDDVIIFYLFSSVNNAIKLFNGKSPKTCKTRVDNFKKVLEKISTVTGSNQ